MYCKYCGKLIDNNSSFCSYCGKPQHINNTTVNTSSNKVDIKDKKESPTKSVSPPNANNNSTKHNAKRSYTIFILAISILATLVLGLWLFLQRKDKADITICQVSKELAEATKRYDELYNFSDGLAIVCKNKKYGFIDKLGHEIIPCKYDYAQDFINGISIVTMDKKQGAINEQGSIVIPCKYDAINRNDKDSLMVTILNGKWGFLDLKGNIAIPFEYDYCCQFREGLAAIEQNGLYGFINKKGEIIIPCQYKKISQSTVFSDGLIGVCRDVQWGYIDKTGKLVIPFQEGLTDVPFSSGLSVKYKYKYRYEYNELLKMQTRSPYSASAAFINKEGELVSDYFEANIVQGFRDGYCVIKDKYNREGLINEHGEFVIPCKYDFILNVSDNEFVVICDNNKEGIANKATGQIVIPIIYEHINNPWDVFKEGVVSVEKDDKWGFIDKNNQVVIPFIYDNASSFSEGFAVVERYGKYGYVDRFGHDTFEFQ